MACVVTRIGLDDKQELEVRRVRLMARETTDRGRIAFQGLIGAGDRMPPDRMVLREPGSQVQERHFLAQSRSDHNAPRYGSAVRLIIQFQPFARVTA